MAKKLSKHTGRPKKDYKTLLPHDWEDRIFAMSAEGCSDVEIRAAIMTSEGMKAKAIVGMYYRLQQRDEEFCRAIKLAKILCEAWWHKAGRKCLKEQYFQHFVWMANMKNRFNWRDKTELEHTVPDNLVEKFKDMSIDQLKMRLNAIIGPVTGPQ